MRVAILTFPGDFHAHAVAWGIKARGHGCDLIFLGDLPQQAVLTVDPSSPGYVVFGSGEDCIDFRNYDRFWLRRPSDALLPEDIHPNDRRFARQAWDFLKESILRALGETGAFCVNPPAAAETSRMKTYQLVLARQVGLKVPPTIATNDGESARRFIRASAEQGSRTIVKGVHTMIWDLEDGGLAEFVTARVTADDIDDAGLRLAPVIFQAEVPKAFEARITVMGNSTFAARLDSQKSTATELDYRAHADWSALGCEPIEVPDDVNRRIMEFQFRSGLNFGTMDFIVTPAGEWIFLETNPQGQFLWVEEIHEATPMLDAFVSFLLEGRDGFVYRQDESERLRLGAFQALDPLNSFVIEERSHHVVRGSNTIPERHLSGG